MDVKEFQFEDKNTIVNFSNSILKCFGAPTHHPSIPEIDEILKGHKKVVFMLFDGFGSNIRKLHLNKDSNLNTHFVHKMKATFPPTTVASTNGLLTGLYPVENGWLSWRQYYKEVNCNVLVFKSVDENFEKHFDSKSGNFHEDHFPIVDILSQVNRIDPSIAINKIFPTPINDKGPKSKNFYGYYRRINKFLKNKEKCLMYVYNDEPDTTLHYSGISNKKVTKITNKIDKFCLKVANKNKDTLFLVIADHGLIDVDMIHIYEHPDLLDTLKYPPSFECRSTTFFVKDGQKKLFKELFNKYYGDKFILLTKKEVLENNMYGIGNINEKSVEFMGDYFSISNNRYSFELMKKVDPRYNFKAHHAGLTKEEMEIDISAFNV